MREQAMKQLSRSVPALFPAYLQTHILQKSTGSNCLKSKNCCFYPASIFMMNCEKAFKRATPSTWKQLQYRLNVKKMKHI